MVCYRKVKSNFFGDLFLCGITGKSIKILFL